jgi:hypothetical protein
VGEDLIDSVVSDNIPILTEQEKFNETVSSIVKRVEAKLTGVDTQGMLCCALWFFGNAAQCLRQVQAIRP